jgi:beta-lactam-binding protein with PASTA domain
LSNAVDTQTAAVKQATIAAAATANAVDTQTAAVRQNTTAAAATATDAFVATAFANAAATQTAAVKQTAAVAATAAATDAFVATATANATEEVMVTVPNVVGTDSGSAEAAIYGSGLVANTTFGGTGCTPYMVNWQDPAAGTQVSTGSSVTIQVCPGIVVPNVIGMDKNAASGTLSNAGLGVSLVSTCDGDKPDGQVWSTAPGPGSSVSPGTVVTVNYYTGCGDDIINAIP